MNKNLKNLKTPLVSIIISTFNNEKTIGLCLKSIKNQSYKKIEVIVVDEWSDDKTAKIAKSFNAKVFFHGKERANNRNLGIEKSKGEFYFILDSDMELEKEVVAECVNICTKKIADGVVVSEKSIGDGYWANVRAFERIYNRGNNNVEAARFFPKRIIKKIGGYDPGIVGAEDWDLQQRFLQHGFTLARTKSYLIHHEGNMNLGRLLKKKMYYGKAFLLYQKRYPEAFKKAIIRKELFGHWFEFVKKPKYGFGVFMLKCLEGSSLFIGMFMAKIGRDVSHY
jgi:glycosyltransferase involved in cell wall biosynthesis